MSTTDALARGARRTRGVGARAKDGDWVERAGRLGHIAKGVSYLAIAVLALQVAFGERRRPEDRQGVLREVASSSFGTAALWVLTVGFAGYALWQFARAFFDRSRDGSDAGGLAKRAHHLGVGLIYVGSAVAAASLATGSGTTAGGDERAETAKVLEWPMGRWIVAAVGLGLFGYGVANVVKAKTQKFRKDLDEGRMSPTVRRWTTRAGTVGHAARGVVFGMVG